MGVNFGLLYCGKNQVRGVREEGAEGNTCAVEGKKRQGTGRAAYLGAS